MSIETLIRCAARREPLSAETEVPMPMVRRQGLGPLAHSLGLAGYASDAIASSLMHERQSQDAREATAALAARGIPALLIKGTVSARRHYDEPGHRPMTDIDILVPRDAHAEAADALRRCGYWPAGTAAERRRFHHALTLKRPGAAIDLHRSLVQPLRRGADIAGLWKRVERGTDDLPDALFPSRTDETLLTLVHIARHELAVRALTYVDAARMLATIDLGLLEERGRRAGLWRGVSAAIELTTVLTGASCPENLRDVFTDVVRRREPTRRRQLVRKLGLLEDPGDAARLVIGALLERVG